MRIFGNLFSKIGNNAINSSVVGVDIGSSSIKVVELQDKGGVVTLSTYGELQLGPYVEKSVGESAVLSPKQEQEALVDVLRESAVTAKDAVFAMPLSSSFVTNVTIRASAEADLSAMVRVEARKVIPASLSEVTLDWAEVDAEKQTSKAGTATDRKVLIAAIQNNALERYRVLMQFANLKQPPTEIECFSSVRSLHDSTEDDVVIIDIGARSAKLYIAHKGLLMRIHRVRAGGAMVTEGIAKQHQLSFEDAEIKKQTLQRSDADFVGIQTVHNEVYERAFREFAQVIKEYEQNNNVRFTVIYLSGGSALFPGIDALLKQTAHKEVLLANPFKKVAYPAFMQDTMKEIGPAFTVALGAAIRVFD